MWCCNYDGIYISEWFIFPSLFLLFVCCFPNVFRRSNIASTVFALYIQYKWCNCCLCNSSAVFVWRVSVSADPQGIVCPPHITTTSRDVNKSQIRKWNRSTFLFPYGMRTISHLSPFPGYSTLWTRRWGCKLLAYKIVDSRVVTKTWHERNG